MDKNIITGMSSDCIYQDSCKKYIENHNCECMQSDIWCDRVARLQILYNNTLLTKAQQQPKILKMNERGEDYQQFKQLALMSRHMNDFVNKGCNLYIHSRNCGNGKTSWAIKLLQEYLAAVWYKVTPTECQAMFVNIPRFLLELKRNISAPSEYAQFVLDNALKAKLVVWDEIGTKQLTQFENEHLLSLINARLDLGLANIYTSNLDDNALLEQLGARLHSRILNTSYNIEFNATDKRGMVAH